MTGGNRAPTWKERENNKRRERRRRAISAKIFAGLRHYGNYKLPKHCDNNEVLKALCSEAGWTVHPDGTTYRKGSKPVESMDIIGRSISAIPSSSYQPSPWASFSPSPMSSSFASPSSSSYTTNANNPEGNCLIPWLNYLSSSSSASSSSSSSKLHHHYFNSGSISAPVTPPLSSSNSNWGPHYPIFPSSTPPSPSRAQTKASHPDWLTGIRVPTYPTFTRMSPHSRTMVGGGVGSGSGSGSSSRVLTPLQSGTCSPATVNVAMAEVMVSDEFAFNSSSSSSAKGLVKAWEGERIHEGSDDLELTLGCSRTR